MKEKNNKWDLARSNANYRKWAISSKTIFLLAFFLRKQSVFSTGYHSFLALKLEQAKFHFSPFSFDNSYFWTFSILVFQLYIFPNLKLFDDIFNSFRLLGSVILLILGTIVLAGVRVS